MSTLFLPTWLETEVLPAPNNCRGLARLSAFLEGQSIDMTIPAFKVGPLALMTAKICFKSRNGSQNRRQLKRRFLISLFLSEPHILWVPGDFSSGSVKFNRFQVCKSPSSAYPVYKCSKILLILLTIGYT